MDYIWLFLLQSFWSNFNFCINVHYCSLVWSLLVCTSRVPVLFFGDCYHFQYWNLYFRLVGFCILQTSFLTWNKTTISFDISFRKCVQIQTSSLGQQPFLKLEQAGNFRKTMTISSKCSIIH